MCTCVTGHHPGLQGPIPQKPWPADPRSLELLAKPCGQEGLVGDTAPCNPETCRQDPERGWRRSRAQDQLPAASGGRRWGERAGKAECAQSEPVPQWPPGRRRDPPVSQPGSPGSLPRSHAADHLTHEPLDPGCRVGRRRGAVPDGVGPGRPSLPLQPRSGGLATGPALPATSLTLSFLLPS